MQFEKCIIAIPFLELQLRKAIISNEIPECNSKNLTIAILNLKLYNCNFKKQLIQMQFPNEIPKT